MNAAIAKARASLEVFWHQCGKPDVDVSHLSLKVRIRDGEKVEHFWLVDVKCQGNTLSGVIDNDPELVKNVKIGQRYEFAEADISDWMYLHSGKIVGNETLRVLIRRMPADQAAQYQLMYEKP